MIVQLTSQPIAVVTFTKYLPCGVVHDHAHCVQNMQKAKYEQ
jgi:hypothetical protein